MSAQWGRLLLLRDSGWYFSGRIETMSQHVTETAARCDDNARSSGCLAEWKVFSLLDHLSERRVCAELSIMWTWGMFPGFGHGLYEEVVFQGLAIWFIAFMFREPLDCKSVNYLLISTMKPDSLSSCVIILIKGRWTRCQGDMWH